MSKSKPNTDPQDDGRVQNGLKIDEIEKRYDARFVGVYGGAGRERAYLIFYVENPDREKGHDNYFGMHRDIIMVGDRAEYAGVWITNGKWIRDMEYPALQLKDGTFLVTRSIHDYVTGSRGEMLDGGGGAYCRYNPEFPPTHRMTVVDGNEVFSLIADEERTERVAPTKEIDPLEVLERRYHNAATNGVSGLLYDVGFFHIAADQPVRYTPAIPCEAEAVFRDDLIAEEYKEYQVAREANDIVGIADAIGDMIYVLIGACHHYGIPLDDVWDEIHGSNMAKIDMATGKVKKRADGKVLKPEGWKPPDIREAMGLND